jgi:DNA polymerase III subunit epsilon
LHYAIVDIETTGGYAAANGIIEISIQVFDGTTVIEQFETLVNPGVAIPKYIQAFTGINDEMVKDAPPFEEIARQVYYLLHDKIFVAHNVNFDYSFLKNHLEYYGYTLNTKKLCTIRLARQIIPGLPAYGLGKLCKSLGIELHTHHRAGSDAVATTDLFKLLLAKDEKGFIKASLERTSKEKILPPNVPVDDFRKLPTTPGVYYFHDSKGKIVYVGKAKNIKQRVNSHFSNNSDGKQKQNFIRYVHNITYQSTATELMAAILESTEIKKLWPAFNVSQKSPEEAYSLIMYEDQKGYFRLAVEKKKKHSKAIYTFHYKVHAHGVLQKLIKEFNLCPVLCFVQNDRQQCEGIKEGYCLGACETSEASETYNKRILEAIASLTLRSSYVVLDKGLKKEEMSCIMISKGSFFGMGYLPKNFTNITEGAIAKYINPYPENSFIKTILQTHLSKFPQQVVYLAK